MGITTSARTVIVKVLFYALCFLMIFCLNDYFSFSMDIRGICSTLAFTVAYVVFANMVIEDYKDELVDIYKALGLAFALGFATSRSLALFFGCLIFTAMSLLIFYYVSVLVLSCFYARGKNDLSKQEKEVCIKEIQEEQAFSFLPSFAGGIIIFGLLLKGDYLPNEILIGLRSLFDMLIILSNLDFFAVSLVILTSILFFFKYQAKKAIEDGLIPIEGIGMGDIIVLPIFAAFFGIADFLLVLVFSLAIQVSRFYCKKYNVSCFLRNRVFGRNRKKEETVNVS